jgi:hypothetical protein
MSACLLLPLEVQVTQGSLAATPLAACWVPSSSIAAPIRPTPMLRLARHLLRVLLLTTPWRSPARVPLLRPAATPTPRLTLDLSLVTQARLLWVTHSSNLVLCPQHQLLLAALSPAMQLVVLLHLAAPHLAALLSQQAVRLLLEWCPRLGQPRRLVHSSWRGLWHCW